MSTDSEIGERRAEAMRRAANERLKDVALTLSESSTFYAGFIEGWIAAMRYADEEWKGQEK